ncbi:MAG: SRPBCC domain-containing protein [Planctomycetota bacterium]
MPPTLPPPGKAVTVRKVFSRETSVSTHVGATPDTVWALLTDAADMTRWNSTLVSFNGDLQPGGRIELVSTLAPKRTFKLKVKELDAPRRLVWGDAMGTRVYTLEPAAGGTHFTMREKIGGPVFPLFARMIPPFDEAFEQFAADLKREAERQSASAAG